VSVRTISENPDQSPTTAPILRLVPPADQLPLEWEVSPGVPAVPGVPPALRIVGDAGPDPEALINLPDPRRWVAQLARAVSEVSVGERPASQLTRWVSRDQLVRIAARADAMRRHPSARNQPGRPQARTVRAVRVCPVAPGIIEASAVLVGGERAQAIAIRIEATAGRWLATAVDLR